MHSDFGGEALRVLGEGGSVESESGRDMRDIAGRKDGHQAGTHSLVSVLPFSLAYCLDRSRGSV